MARLRVLSRLVFLTTLSALVGFAPSTNALVGPSQPRNNHGSVPMNDEQILLPNGVRAQVLFSLPPDGATTTTTKPPILFLHGSFHGAWCWQERYMPYFAERGHPCVAFSWRGTGGNPAGEGVTKVRVVEDHCSDLKALLECLPSILGSKDGDDPDRLRPIVVSHSMGGVV
eukprot:jgi/Psemu1/25962/gm1.25962_g